MKTPRLDQIKVAGIVHLNISKPYPLAQAGKAICDVAVIAHNVNAETASNVPLSSL